MSFAHGSPIGFSALLWLDASYLWGGSGGNKTTVFAARYEGIVLSCTLQAPPPWVAEVNPWFCSSQREQIHGAAPPAPGLEHRVLIKASVR